MRGRMRGKDERGRMWEGEDLRGGGCERGRMRGGCERGKDKRGEDEGEDVKKGGCEVCVCVCGGGMRT